MCLTTGRLTTHVLDTVHGGPAAGMTVSLWRMPPGSAPVWVSDWVLNADGRAQRALLEGDSLLPGRYRLLFGVGAYFQRRATVLPEPAFLDEVPIDFGLADTAAHYHVPLLVSPWAYSTYRGS
jgi:5-hydroxyisourate hydrolase